MGEIGYGNFDVDKELDLKSGVEDAKANELAVHKKETEMNAKGPNDVVLKIEATTGATNQKIHEMILMKQKNYKSEKQVAKVVKMVEGTMKPEIDANDQNYKVVKGEIVEPTNMIVEPTNMEEKPEVPKQRIREVYHMDVAKIIIERNQ